MQRKYEDRYVTSIPLEKSVYFRVKKLLPKDVYVADEINEFLKQRLADLEIDKNLSDSDSNKAPVKIYKNNISRINTVLEQKQKIPDIYSPKEVIKDYVNNINDVSTAWELTRQAKFLTSLAETKAKNLQKLR